MCKRIRLGDPLANRNNGRDGKGRFRPGCKPGPGNPMFRQIHEVRKAILAGVTPEDVTEIIRRLVKDAKRGDKLAARIVLERVLGPAVAIDLVARIEELEAIAKTRSIS